MQYNFEQDTSDEKWTLPVIWFIPSLGAVIAIVVIFASGFRFQKLLFGVFSS
jgi:hypothetical protein